MKTDLSSSLTAALSGLQVGIKNARSAANEVAKLTSKSESVQNTVKPLLELQQAEQTAAVSGKVIKTETDTLGKFIDETV